MWLDHTRKNKRLTSLFPMAVFLTTAICLLGLDAVNGSAVQSVDDFARRLQITDLLADDDWYDLTWPFLAMPGPYVSPWSRLVDLPYVLVTWLFQPALGQDTAFAVARFIVPPLWLVAYAWLGVNLIREIRGKTPGLRVLAISVVASYFAILEFMPNRIDHHNVQMVLLFAFCLGIISPHRHAGILIGISSILSVAVGLECAPYIAVGLGGLAILGAMQPQSHMPRKFVWTCITLVVLTLPVGLLLNGNTIFQTHCDALSAPWVSALAAGGILGAGSALVWRWAGWEAPLPRMAILMGGGIIVLAGLWLAFPECHAGPYPMVNETAHTYWLDHVMQEKDPITAFSYGEQMFTLIFLALISLVIVAWQSVKGQRPEVFLLLLIASLGVILTAWQMRNFRFPAALLPLFVPLFIGMLRESETLRPLMLALTVPIVLFLSFQIFVKPQGRSLSMIDYMRGDTCLSGDLSLVDTLPPSRFAAPFGLSLTLADHIQSSGTSHTLAALQFHRASPGMERIFRTFILTDTELRRQALEPYDYIAVCVIPENDADPKIAPLYAHLSSGGDWPGLKDIQKERTSRLRILKIDHDTVE